MDITAFEAIRADLSGLQALATLFTDTFATYSDEDTLLKTIAFRKDVFVDSAWLMADLINRIGEDMDEAIDACTPAA